MDDVMAPREAEAPWWLGAVHKDDVLEVAEAFETASAVLSVAETLLAVELAGPGAKAITLLESLTGLPMSDGQRLTAIELWQPNMAWVTGQEQAAVSALVGPERPVTAETVNEPSTDFHHLELAAAWSCSADHAKQRIWQARLLSGAFNATGDALRSGELDPYRVWVMLETLTTLPAELAQQVEADLLPSAAGLTGPRLRRALRKAARRVDPDWSAREFAKKRTTRRVSFTPEVEPGLTLMSALLPAVEATAIEAHLHQAARTPSPDPLDPRTVEEREADALVACVLGSTPDDPTTPLMPKITLQVLTSLPTLMGLREDPGELKGYGEIPAEVVRELAGDADWERWVYEPVNGHLIDQGNETYQPKAALYRFCRNRDRYCQFPGSNRSADHADLDHIEAFKQGEGGNTSADNLASLSRTPHRAKTLTDWTYRRNPDGTLTWTTPLGRTYTTGPYDYRPDSER